MKARISMLTLGCQFIALIASAGTAFGDGQYCDDNSGASPYICVKWSQGSNPVPGNNILFDFTDADYPDVKFITGDGDWRVWSQVDDTNTTPDNLGDLTIDADVLTDDFTVSIYNDDASGPGAANVASAVLKDPNVNWTGFSRVSGTVTGNITGDLEIVKDSGGTGGDANGFTVEGDVIGDITLADAGGFMIEGDLVGEVAIGEGAGFTIEGTLGPASFPTKVFHVDTITNGMLTVGAE